MLVACSETALCAGSLQRRWRAARATLWRWETCLALPSQLARVPARARLSRADRLERRMSESCLECLRASPSPPPASPPEARAWRAGRSDARMHAVTRYRGDGMSGTIGSHIPAELVDRFHETQRIGRMELKPTDLILRRRDAA